MLTFTEVAASIRAEIVALDATIDRRVAAAAAATEFNAFTDRLERLFDDLVIDGQAAGREREMRGLVRELDTHIASLRPSVAEISSYDLYDRLRTLAADCDEQHQARRGPLRLARFRRRW